MKVGHGESAQTGPGRGFLVWAAPDRPEIEIVEKNMNLPVTS